MYFSSRTIKQSKKFNQTSPRKEGLSMPTIALNTASATLKKSFEAQVEALSATGLASEPELSALFPLLEKVGKVTNGEGRIPFVIVVQKPGLTPSERMGKVWLHGKKGASNIGNGRVTNLDNIPQGHYLALDVEDGRAARKTKPSVCLEQFMRDKRSGGTVAEGISLITYDPEILFDHEIDLPGSRYAGDFVPFLHIFACMPELDAHCFNIACSDSGSLSCAGRLGLGT